MRLNCNRNTFSFYAFLHESATAIAPTSEYLENDLIIIRTSFPTFQFNFRFVLLCYPNVFRTFLSKTFNVIFLTTYNEIGYYISFAFLLLLKYSDIVEQGCPIRHPWVPLRSSQIFLRPFGGLLLLIF